MAVLDKIDWNLIQAFLAVAETGSLSGAARRLGLSQPTIGRQVQALEAQLDATLFDRKPRGMALTLAGQGLLAPAQAMQAAAADLALVAAGADRGLSGTVRITASAMMAVHHLPPILAGLRRAHPEMRIDLVASDRSDNLLFREADIALRMYRPNQLDMVTKHLGDIEIGLYAARSYLQHRPPPMTASEILDHDIVGFDADDRLIRAMRDAGHVVERDTFPVRCDDNVAQYELIRAGCGLGFAQVAVAGHDPDLERLLPDLPLPRLPIWLTCHEALRQTPRVTRVWTALEQGLAPLLEKPGQRVS